MNDFSLNSFHTYSRKKLGRLSLLSVFDSGFDIDFNTFTINGNSSHPSLSSFTRYDHDSGHDSGSEDTCYELSQPFTLLTLGMGKLFIPKASSSASGSTANAASGDPGNRVLPMPQRLGVCLDYDACRVYFYDADTMRCLYERQVDCSGTMYPAFGLMGSGKVQLEEFITAKRLAFW